MLTFITTPTDLIGQISPVATGLIGDFAPYAALIIGIAIGLWIVGWLIDKIRGKPAVFTSERLADSGEHRIAVDDDDDIF